MEKKIWPFVVFSISVHLILLVVWFYHHSNNPIVWIGGAQGIVEVRLVSEEVVAGEKGIGGEVKDNLKNKSAIVEPEKVTGGVGEGYDSTGPANPSNPVLAQIYQRILRSKQFPLLARKQGMEGNVSLSFNLQTDGRIEHVLVTGSSGFSILDEEAIATIKRGQPYPYFAGQVQISLKYDLEE